MTLRRFMSRLRDINRILLEFTQHQDPVLARARLLPVTFDFRVYDTREMG